MGSPVNPPRGGAGGSPSTGRHGGVGCPAGPRMLGAIACLLAAPVAAAQSSAPITLVVRVFDGTMEVTDRSAVTVYDADDRERPMPAAPGPDGHTAEVPPALYDLRITVERTDGTTGIAWAEHLSVLPYPDEEIAHLEIVNLRREYGALVVRPPTSWRDIGRPWRVRAFARDGSPTAGEVTGGAARRLFVLPAGRYDLRASLDASEAAARDVEVPAGRTRLLTLAVD